jgi:tRNA(Ser,Leu) C12 N-acetylase TAN1
MAWSGQDLEDATSAAGALLEEMGLEAYLFAVEPREGDWELKLECALKDGWQMIALPVDLELLLASRTERSARSRLLRNWGARLTACLKREDRESRVQRAGEDRALGQPSRRRLVPAAKKPSDWNVLVTAQPGPQHTRPLLSGLRQYGEFRGTEFRDVCIGWVDDVGGFLESVRVAAEAHASWTRHLSRVIPVERTFRFTPETLVALLADAVTPFVERIDSGSLYVRVERRGLMGRVPSAEVERAVADHIFEVAARRGKALRTSFADPDWIVVAETIGGRCGVSLLPREMRRRYAFVQPR